MLCTIFNCLFANVNPFKSFVEKIGYKLAYDTCIQYVHGNNCHSVLSKKIIDNYDHYYNFE